MIGTRTPFRISFAGGGSDMKEFYSEHPGCVLSASIDKYMYIFIHPFFDRKIQVKYSKTELVDKIDDIQHPIVREALRKFRINGVDINSIGDIPAGTGLGSSSSFTVGLLHALYAYTSTYPSKEMLASEASSLEIDVLKEPIGKQDQYAAAYGGLNLITFHPNGSVNVEPLIMDKQKFEELESNLLMFYIGKARPAGSILSDQKKNITTDNSKFNALKTMTELTLQLKQCLVKGDIDSMGRILDENWKLKKTLSNKISDAAIEHFYSTALKNGATGGKLLGAGGGGFLLFYCEKENQERLKVSLKDLREVGFKFDDFGSKVIYFGER